MPKIRKDYRPLNEGGVDFNNPEYMRKFRKMDNTYFDQGRLRTRPGLKVTGPYKHPTGGGAALAGCVGPITDMVEVRTHKEIPFTETLVPASTTSITDWTIVGAATAHEATDDDPSDEETTYITTGTLGATVVLKMGALSEVRDRGGGLVVLIRARIQGESNQVATIRCYYVSGGTDYFFGDFVVTANVDSDEADVWQTIIVESSVDPRFSYPWSSSNSPSESSWKFELLSGASDTFSVLEPNANAADIGWDASATAWQSIVSGASWFVDGVKTWDNSLSSSSEGSKQGVNFTTPGTTLTSISNIRFIAVVGRSTGVPPTQVKLYYKGTDSVDYQIGTEQFIKHSNLHSTWAKYALGFRISIDVPLNPETGNAWTNSEMAAINMVIEHSGGGDVQWGGAELHITGQRTPTVEVTQVQAEMWGWDVSGAGADDLMSQLIIQNCGLYQAYPDNTALVDVQNSKTWAGPAGLQSGNATLNGTVYAGNGIDQLIFFPVDASNDLWGQLSGKPLGAILEVYGARLLIADPIESGTRNAERIRWSKVNDATDWADVTAGFLDIHDTPGKFVALKNLLGSCIAYKNTSIYEIIVQPDVYQPYRHFERSSTVGCAAGGTVQHSSINGTPGHLFLGDGPGGLNVYFYTGGQVIPIGDPIKDELTNRTDYFSLEYAHAVMDPLTKMYLLFMPETNETHADNCWAYHVPTNTWREWTFPMNITSSGIWTIQYPSEYAPTTGGHVQGRKMAVLGGAGGLAYILDPDFHLDFAGPGEANTANWDSPGFYVSGNSYTPKLASIAYILETGDLFDDKGKLISAATVYLWVKDQGPCRVKISTSVDGGVTYTEQDTITIGSEDESGKVMYRELSFDIENSLRCSVKLEEVTDESYRGGDFVLEDFAIELDVGGERV